MAYPKKDNLKWFVHRANPSIEVTYEINSGCYLLSSFSVMISEAIEDWLIVLDVDEEFQNTMQKSLEISREFIERHSSEKTFQDKIWDSVAE